MVKIKLKTRKQKGGNYFTSQQQYNTNGYNSNQYLNNIDNKLGSFFTQLTSSVSNGVSNLWNKTKNTIYSTSNNTSKSNYNYSTNSTYGGKRKKIYKGGKGGLGLDYYATSVSNIKVAEPTYTMKYGLVCGGKRKRKNKNTKKNRKIKGGKTF